MRSYFAVGFSQDTFSARIQSRMLGQVRLLGQGESPLSKDDRNRLVTQIQAAADKLAVINAWSEAHPNPTAADLGADLAAWNAQSVNQLTFTDRVTTVYQQMAPEQDSYNVSSADLNAIPGYVAAIDALYAIVQRHGAAAPKPGAKPGAIAPAASLTTPLLVGAGVLAVGVIAILASA